MTACPESETLALLLQEKLDSPLRERVEAHIEHCGACQGELDRLNSAATPLRAPHFRHGAEPGKFLATGSFLARLGNRSAFFLASPASMPKIEGYEILGELGSGGMGRVYRARHLGLGRQVALKVIKPGPSSELLRSRLEQEALALARLRHPNIVQVHDVGESDGQAYLALELIEGTTLSAWLNGRPQPSDTAAHLAWVLAGAVDYAHRNGILHRDLKPSNVLVESDPGDAPSAAASSKAAPPRIKITDFGLAKAIAEGDPLAVGLTATGELVGTPQYMAPEQGSGLRGPIGIGADVYSIGVILYELLTGQPPFRGETPLKTILQVVHEPPPSLSRLRPGLPMDLATICMKCLEKNASSRYHSAGALAEDLRRFLAREPIAARPVGPLGKLVRWARRKPLLAAMAGTTIGVAAVAFALVTWQWRDAEVARAKAEALATSEAAATAEARAERDKAGRLAVELFLEDNLSACERGEVGAGLQGLARTLRRAEGLGLGPLAETCRANIACWSRRQGAASEGPPLGSSAMSVAFSPDGTRILSGQWINPGMKAGPGIAQLWDLDGWKPIGPAIPHQGGVTAVAFSPDGTRILTSAASGAVRLWDAATGEPTGPTFRGLKAATTVAFHPDGKRFAAGGVANEAGNRRDVCIWDASAMGDAPIATYSFAGTVEAIAFSPDGKALATASRVPETEAASASAEVCQWDLATKGRKGPRLVHSSSARAIAYSPDGKLLATGGGDRVVVLWDAATGKRTGRSFVHPGVIFTLAFSPDGKALAVAGGEFRSSESLARRAATARLWDVATGRPRSAPLEHPDVIHSIAFDRDSRRVATACRDGHIRVFEASPDLIVERALPSPYTSLAFSPDGRALIMAGGPGKAAGGSSQALDPATGAPLRPEIKHPAWACALAVERKSGAYAVAREDGTVLVLDPADDRPLGPPLVQPGCAESLTFSADGELLLATDPGDWSRLWKWRAGELVWATRPGETSNSVSLRPDGRMILIDRKKGGLSLHDVAKDAPAGDLWAGPPRRFISCGFSPNGLLAIAGDDNRVINCWELASGRSSEASIDQQVAWRAGFIGAGPRAYVVAGYGIPSYGYAYLWDPSSGNPPKQLPHLINIRAVAFSPDHRFMATGGWSGGVRLWDAATGYQIGPELPGAGNIVAIACSPDGRTIAAADEHNALSIWRIPLPGPASPATPSQAEGP